MLTDGMEGWGWEWKYSRSLRPSNLEWRDTDRSVISHIVDIRLALFGGARR